ncbi:MAG TPA: hypothetical protein VK790_05370 [Solirubrobacteraceae bacterium]|jgi:hypothetical protein|nr:hypothetical protein [Solirubrobacteraceae bacterium]
MPFAPKLFSARALARLEETRQRELVRVPFFDGLMAGEPDALVKEIIDAVEAAVDRTAMEGMLEAAFTEASMV